MQFSANCCTHILGRLRCGAICSRIRKFSSPMIACNCHMRGTSSPSCVEDAGAVWRDCNAAGESAKAERLEHCNKERTRMASMRAADNLPQCNDRSEPPAGFPPAPWLKNQAASQRSDVLRTASVEFFDRDIPKLNEARRVQILAVSHSSMVLQRNSAGRWYAD